MRARVGFHCRCAAEQESFQISILALCHFTHKQCVALQGVWGNEFPHRKNKNAQNYRIGVTIQPRNDVVAAFVFERGASGASCLTTMTPGCLAYMLPSANIGAEFCGECLAHSAKSRRQASSGAIVAG